MAAPPIVRVLESELQSRFNGASYLTRTLSGEFTIEPYGPQSVYTNPPGTPPERLEPEGTISGLIEITNPATGERVAIAHRRLRPDGTYGESGKPDPKVVLVNGTLYMQMTKAEREKRGIIGDLKPVEDL